MTTKVTEDLSEGQTLTETADEATVVRNFKVELDEGVGPGTIITVRNTNGVPTVGDVHPTASNLFVETVVINTTPGDNTLYTVICTYTKANAKERLADDNAPAQISIGTTTTTFQTDQDKNGDQMLFTPSTGTGSAEVKALGDLPFRADVPRVLGVFRLVRKETTQPGIKAMLYANKVNSVEFLGLAPGLVYCDSIQGDSSDGGDNYVVTYSFTADPLGWDVRGIYTIDGEPVKDPSLTDGTEKFFDVIDDIDFNALNLQ